VPSSAAAAEEALDEEQDKKLIDAAREQALITGLIRGGWECMGGGGICLSGLGPQYVKELLGHHTHT